MDSLKLFNILQHGKSLYKSVLQLNKLPQTEIIRRNKPAPLNYLLNQPSLTHSLSQEKLTILGLCLAPENYGLTIPEIQTIFKINVRYIRSLFTPTDYRKPCAIGDDAFNIRPDLLLCQKLGCIYQPTAQFEAPWCFADTTGWFWKKMVRWWKWTQKLRFYHKITSNDYCDPKITRSDVSTQKWPKTTCFDSDFWPKTFFPPKYNILKTVLYKASLFSDVWKTSDARVSWNFEISAFIGSEFEQFERVLTGETAHF